MDIQKNPKISIIIPTYQEAGNIPALAGRLYAAAAGQFDLEMIIVDVFTYDALGRRIEKIEYSPGGNTTTRYYYDGWKVLTETDAGQSRQRDFIWGNYLDEALVMVVDSGQSDTDYYYAHDHLFSPVALMEDDGDIVERYEYSAYGELTRLDPDFTEWSGTEAGNPLYFTGQRLDTLGSNGLELMYYKNRYYQPQFGRFIHRDPLGVRDGICLIAFSKGRPHFARSYRPANQYADGDNIYVYVLDNPLRFTDPFGTREYRCSVVENTLKKLNPSTEPLGLGHRFSYKKTKGCFQHMARRHLIWKENTTGISGADIGKYTNAVKKALDAGTTIAGISFPGVGFATDDRIEYPAYFVVGIFRTSYFHWEYPRVPYREKENLQTLVIKCTYGTKKCDDGGNMKLSGKTGDAQYDRSITDMGEYPDNYFWNEVAKFNTDYIYDRTDDDDIDWEKRKFSAPFSMIKNSNRKFMFNGEKAQ